MFNLEKVVLVLFLMGNLLVVYTLLTVEKFYRNLLILVLQNKFYT